MFGCFLTNERALPARSPGRQALLLCATGLFVGCASAPAPEPPAPSLLSVYGTTRFACTLELPSSGRLRTEAEARLSGQRLQLVPRSFAPPPRGGAAGAPASAPWDLSAELGTPFDGTGPQSLLGHFSASFLEAEFAGQIDPTGLAGELSNASGQASGRLSARPIASPAPRAYPDLARRIDSAARGAWVEPRRLELTPWKTFIDDLQRGCAAAQDDVEVWLCFQRALTELNAPGISLVRREADELRSAPAEREAPRSLPSDWVWAKTSQLASEAAIDAAFQSWPLELRGAILDLRGSGPADLHLVRLLAWLDLPAETLGVLASQGYFRADRDADGPILERPAGGLYELPAGGWPATLRLAPGELPPNWLARGRLQLIVLLDQASGPAAVSLALGLRSAGRARLVGRAPARPGEVVRGVALGDGFELNLPVAHFLGQDGLPLLEQPMAVDLPADSPSEADLAAVGLAL